LFQSVLFYFGPRLLQYRVHCMTIACCQRRAIANVDRSSFRDIAVTCAAACATLQEGMGRVGVEGLGCVRDACAQGKLDL